MGAPYNRPIILRSIHDGKRRDALTSAGQLGIMRRKLYVMPQGRTSRRLNALRRNWIVKYERILKHWKIILYNGCVFFLVGYKHRRNMYSMVRKQIKKKQTVEKVAATIKIMY